MGVTGVNVVNDLQSKKFKWEDLGLPQWLIDKLENPPITFARPSIIQSKAIRSLMEKEERRNFIFQSTNGSGKTGAFVIPSILSVDSQINGYQILIVGHTRELNRQTYQFLDALLKESPIKAYLATD